MEQNTISVKKMVRKDALQYEGVTLLTYQIEYPQFQSQMYRVASVNSYYRDEAGRFQRHCETELMKLAVAQYQVDMQMGYPVRVYEAVLTFEITLLTDCIISLYSDRYEYTGGAHGNTLRNSQTWNVQKQSQLRLGQLVRCAINVKAFVLRMIKEQIEKDPEPYFEDYPELVSESYRADHFYCTVHGIVVYYQQYEIAPYSSGIREFLLPYSDCVLPPQKTCT